MLRDLARVGYRAIPFKRQAFGLIRRRFTVPRSIYQHLHFVGPFTVDLGANRSFRIHSDGSVLENDLFWSGYGGDFEGISVRVWAELCHDRLGLILDIGANTGVYALAAAALAPGAEVVAFEPIARMADRLAHNVSLNGFPIGIERAAVTDHSGTVTIYDSMESHNYSASVEGQGAGAASYEVKAVALDDWLSERADGSVTAVKIDIERHEPAALRGMRRLLGERRPPLLIEILDRSVGEQIEELVTGLDYRFFHIDEDRGLISTDRLAPLHGHHWNHLLCDEEDFRERGLDRFLAAP